MTSAANDAGTGPRHYAEGIHAYHVRHWRWFWRRQWLWHASCGCGWSDDYIDAHTAGRALAQHAQWDALTRGIGC